jgi:hypothetical protein
MLHQYDLGLLKTTWEGEVQRERWRMREKIERGSVREIDK